ncbi:MAG: two-component system sensor histidine kinase PhoQ [Halieaceae bacterium]|jgi:two-component system sensor histidine kinase PhoQ
MAALVTSRVARGVPGSIRGRLLLAIALLLPLFLGLTGSLLDRAFYRSLIVAQEERLKLQVYALLAEADYIDELSMPEQLLEARLNQLNSGLYAAIIGADKALRWQSASAAIRDLDTFAERVPDLNAGASDFSQWASHYQYAYKVIWETEAGDEQAFTVLMINSDQSLNAELSAYRANLWIGLLVVGLLLVATLLLIMRWGLRPLKQLAADLEAIEQGHSEQLVGDYPDEVSPVTANLNRLLDTERQRRERYRNTMSDLAHSLKTPLAVMRSGRDRPEVIDEQTDIMQQIVDYQLKRAVNQRENLLKPIALAPAVARMTAALTKVYAATPVDWQVDIPSFLSFRGDEGDLMELLGNILDNACKYGAGKVSISASVIEQTLHLTIGDNGPGVPQQLRGDIIKRGARADTAIKGQGIGLAVVIDIVAAYGGHLSINESSLGGAEFSLSIPQ